MGLRKTHASKYPDERGIQRARSANARGHAGLATNIPEAVYLGSRVIALSRNYAGAEHDHAGSRIVLDMELPRAGGRSFKHSGEFAGLVGTVESAMEPAGILAAEA